MPTGGACISKTASKGSRFCHCPICGVLIACHIAQEHVAACADGDLRTFSHTTIAPEAGPAAAEHDGASSGEHDGKAPLRRHQDKLRVLEEGGAASRSRQLPGQWSFLKTPTAKDVRGPRRTRKALDLPPQAFDFLVVLDFEWTCDNRRRLEPSEIIEFPSVLVRCSFPPQIIDEFQVFCRPQVNPRLSSFCTELTGIGQETVDKGVRLGEALSQHSEWLRKHGLLARDDGQENGARPSTFAIVTWSDADVAMQLNSELSAKNLPRPSHFDRWINLKLLYKQHYKRAPTGGLVSLLPSQTPFSPVKLPSPQSNSLLPSQTPFSPVKLPSPQSISQLPLPLHFPPMHLQRSCDSMPEK
jgi:inhibitor of KinA sporulation pathway (predicted exonuclease)